MENSFQHPSCFLVCVRLCCSCVHEAAWWGMKLPLVEDVHKVYYGRWSSVQIFLIKCMYMSNINARVLAWLHRIIIYLEFIQCSAKKCCFVNWMLEKNSHTLYSLEQKKSQYNYWGVETVSSYRWATWSDSPTIHARGLPGLWRKSRQIKWAVQTSPKLKFCRYFFSVTV